jgi:hypothetical protein
MFTANRFMFREVAASNRAPASLFDCQRCIQGHMGIAPGAHSTSLKRSVSIMRFFLRAAIAAVIPVKR